MKTAGQEAYLADIGRACDDLGWSIRDMEVGRITVVPVGSKKGPFAFVTLDTDRGGLPITGDLLRALLRPQGEPT